MSGQKSRYSVPFTMFSSSANGGYLTDLHANFTGSVEINNLHLDEYGELVGAPLQGPFSSRWVGGHQHRHQDGLRSDNQSTHQNATLAHTYTFVSSSFITDPSATASAFGLKMGESVSAITASQGIYSLVGALDHRNNAVYLHRTNGKTTVQLSKISSPGGTLDSFGNDTHSVDMVSGSDGLYMLIGASDGDTKNSNVGEAFLLRTTDNGANITHWNGVATSSLAPNVLTASSSDSNDFGKSVAVVSSSQGIFSLIGDPGWEGSEANTGAAYLFRTHAGVTSQVQYIEGEDYEEAGKFGFSVSMTSGSDGLYGLVGMPEERKSFLFKFHGNNFQTKTLLQTMTSSTNAEFHGGSTSIVSSSHGIYSLVGSEQNQGEEVILYKTFGSNTSEICVLTGSNAGASTFHGSDVSVQADTNNVYCLITDTAAGTQILSGRAYLYAVHKEVNNPQQVATYETADPDGSPNAYSFFGTCATLVLDAPKNNLYSFIGAPLEDDPQTNAGALHIHKNLLTTVYNPATIVAPTHRPESFHLIPTTSNLRVYGADYPDLHSPRAPFTRDGIAKRPFNVANIRTTTGSFSLGNYNHNIQVVQTTGKTLNPRHFAENSSTYEQYPERKTQEGNVLNSLNDPGGLRNFALPTGSANKSIITSKFSAPGDRYTMSKGFLNPSGEELSVYNALPYRNENVRLDLRESLTRHMSTLGYEVSGSTITTTASFHKVNRNPLRRLEGGYGTTATTGSQYDNFYVQHPIPRSDLSYSWITSSLGTTAMDSLFGYQKNETDISLYIPQKDFTRNRKLYDFNSETNTTLLPIGATKYFHGETRKENSSIFQTSSYDQLGRNIAAVKSGNVTYIAASELDGVNNGLIVLRKSGDNYTVVFEYVSGSTGFGYTPGSLSMVSGANGIFIYAGASTGDQNNTNSGQAYLFKTTDDFSTVTHWNGNSTSVATDPPIIAPFSSANQYFGTSTDVVYVPRTTTDYIYTFTGVPRTGASGRVYVAEVRSSAIGATQTINCPDPVSGDGFGTAVSAVSGSDGFYILAGEKHLNNYSSAYLIKLDNPTSWNQSTVNTFNSSMTNFGSSCAIASSSFGIYSLIGSNEGSSTVELHKTLNGTTSLVSTMTGSTNLAGDDEFGYSLSVAVRRSGDVYSLVGAPSADSAGHQAKGLAYLFHTTPEGVTTEIHKLQTVDPSTTTYERFGKGVELLLDEDNEQIHLFVGQPWNDYSGFSGNEGAVNSYTYKYNLEYLIPNLSPHSTWSTLRRTDDQPVRHFRDNNLLSFWNSSTEKTYANTTVVSQSAVTSRNKPLQHIGLISGDTSGKQRNFKSSFTNQTNLFSRQKKMNIENKLGVTEGGDTFYSTIKGCYIGENLETENTPFSIVSKVKVSDTIYPLEKSTYSIDSRSRTNYTEESGTGPNGYDRQYGKQNTFFHSSKIRSDDTKNSFGFASTLVISSNQTTNIDFGTQEDHPASPSNMMTKHTRLMPDTTAGGVAMRFGHDGELWNTERYAQFSFDVSGSTSVAFSFVKGAYSPLSLDASEVGEDILIEFQDPSDLVWTQAYVSGTGTNELQTAIISSSAGSSTGNGSYSTLRNYFQTAIAASMSFSSDSVPLVASASTGPHIFNAGTKIRIVQKQHGANYLDGFAIKDLSITAPQSSQPAEHKAFFPLQTDGRSSFSLSSSYRGRVGELLMDTDESAYSSNPTPAQCFVESTALTRNGMLSDYLERTTNTIAGINPWEDSYDDFREDFRGSSKDMTVLPEFRISDHLDTYYENLDFSKLPANYLKLQGGTLSEGEINDHLDDQFIDKYTTSEPLRKYKNFLKDHQDSNFDVDSISIRVDAIKKLLPYNGFYPMTRTVQLGNLLSASFIDNVTGKQGQGESAQTGFNTQGFQAISKTLMSPGILYNSIKAGYGVSYPVYSKPPVTVIDTSSSFGNVYEDFHIESAPNYQIPFEALINPKGNIREDEDIVFTPSWTSTTPTAPAYDYSGQWNGISKPQFQLGMHNFLAETVKFFIEDSKLRTFVSQPERSDSAFSAEAGKTYYMDVLLRDRVKMDRAPTYSGGLSSSADAHLNIGTTQFDVVSGSDGFYMATRQTNPFDIFIQTGYPPRISLYKRTYDAQPWERLDSFTINQQSLSGYHDAPIKLVSGSTGIYVAVKTHKNDDKIENQKVRVYKYSSNSFDTVNYDEIGADPILSPGTTCHFASDFKLESAAHGGYYLLSNYYTNAGFSYNITSSAGFGSSTTSVSIPSQTRVLTLHESSSADGTVLRNVFHNVTSNPSTNTFAKKGFADNGTFDMVSASYSDIPGGYMSSSMGGLIITCGHYADSGSINSTAQNWVGSVNLYYSSSFHGTASANVKNPNENVGLSVTRAKDFFGIRTSVTNNTTGPNRKFYFAATTLKNTSYTGYDYGSVQVFSGSVQSGSSAGLKFKDVGRMETFNKTYIDTSGLTSAEENKEFHTNGGINSYPSVSSELNRSVSMGSDIDLISSNFSDGVENKLYLAVSNPSAEYKQEGTAATGSLMLLTLSGGVDQSGVASGNFTFLPSYLLTDMTSSYVFANNNPYWSYLQMPFPTTAKTAFIKLISSSAHPYNPGDELSLFSSNDVLKYNRNNLNFETIGGYSNNSNASSADTHIVMHTGSAFVGTGFGKTYSNLNTRVATPNFSASVQISSDFVYRKDGSLYGQGIGNAYDPAYAAYTPPSYYGTSIARISYTAPSAGGEGTVTVDLDDIFKNSKVEEIINVDNTRVAKFFSKDQKMTELQSQSRMPVSSSVNLFGRFVPTGPNGEKDSTNEQWIISTRFESPVLDFSTNDAAHSSAYTSNHSDMLPSFNFDTGQSHLPPRSMWTSYGTVPSDEKGITLELAESYDPESYSISDSGSLIELCGFQESTVPRKIGQVAQEKEISEALVLIPYVKSSGGIQVTYVDESVFPITTNGKTATSNALPQNKHTGTQQQKNKISQFKSMNSFVPVPNFLRQLKNYDNPTTDTEENSITNMIRGMERYILPPHLDFLKRSRRRLSSYGVGSYHIPFAMYFVEVDHTLDQQDLSDIWQGVMPEIARNFEAIQEEISHPIDNNNFFATSDKLYEAIQKDLSFLVFKVKRRAETNYYNVTRDSTDDKNFSFKFENDQGVVPQYSYNWPYDFFSLVETAKITVDLDLKNRDAPDED